MRRAALAALLLCGCAREPFALREAPDPGKALRLNEPIVLSFSRAIAPGSRLPSSLRLVHASDGRDVAGCWRVDGATATFAPTPPCAPDLADAAFAPGEELVLELVGLPRMTALRSQDGAGLAAGATWRLVALPATAHWQERPAPELFVDPLPGPPALLTRPARLEGDRLVLRFSEPLDPRALARARFWLHGPWSRASDPSDNPRMTARRIDAQGETVVELTLDPATPLPMPLAPGSADELSLRLEPELLQDLGGAPLMQNGKLVDPWVRVEVARR